MAMTKRFKRLPKDAKRAAFAAMDDRGGSSPNFSKKVKASSKTFRHIQTDEQKRMLDLSSAAFNASGADKKRMLSDLVQGRKSSLENLRAPEGNKPKAKAFLATERAFRFLNKLK